MNKQQQEQLLAYTHAHGYQDTSTRYQACQIRLTLSQPIGGYDPIHLDGLLQAALVQDALQGVPLERSHTPYRIPLPVEVIWRSPEGLPLYHCSSLLPQGGVKQSVYTWTKKNDESISRFAVRKKDGTEWQPDNGSGQNKEYCMPLPIKSISCLIGYAVGDLEEIRRLLVGLSGIGKKVSWGLGNMTSVAVEPSPLESRWCFVRGERLLRPVPLAACRDLGLKPVGDSQLVGYTPPYWLSVNQAPCLVEHQQVIEGVSTSPLSVEHLSVPAFLYQCYVADSLNHITDRGEVTLQHRKLVYGRGIGEPCALTGLPILAPGAVPAKDALSSNMGNVVDFCHAPQSKWVANDAAILLGMPKQMHRNLVALIHPTKSQDAHLLWPSIAVDPTNPTQRRPLWREVLLALQERYQGYRCILIFKDEPKSRTWPRARIGTIGEQTTLLIKESQFGLEAVLQISIPEAIRQMAYIESLLDAGYGKMEIRHGLKSPAIDRLIETLAIEEKLSTMRTTPEFPFIWYIARIKEDRAVRKDISLELD